ncbi:hypothetical protein Patl1_04897 [Pistacia atlantica]|uniref:Uncharacterized protein n=1 Tax=Pistacia atlantica TaxID=434234 RepID=A0ACC1BVC6_9ROSI|nr:hypothetical protein Patl1_04897 [Pistacia atlantica]
MRESHLFITLTLLIAFTLQFQAHAAPAGPLIKHLSSLLKWTTRSSSKAPQSDGNVLQFENGYLVETVVEGNEIGVVPYKIRVSEDGELFAVDEVNSNIVKITPPLSQYSRGRLVAGSFQGYTGHVDGKPNEARFNHPKGVTMDDKGNLYVADTLNLAIRKIGDAGMWIWLLFAGVTTIAGGKSNIAGFRDGPSEDAKFSNDFDVVYVRPTCSLLVVDRGNAALRQISLNQDDCEYQADSISPTDILMVIGAVLVGYATCMLQQGFGPSFFSRTQQPFESEFKEQPNKEKSTLIADRMKEEPGWPSFGQLIIDLSKFAFEAIGGVFLYFIPSRTRPGGSKGLMPLRDTLRMPEDEVEPPLMQRQKSAAPLSEAHHIHTPNTTDKYSEAKPPKIKSSSFKDPSLSTKHRSSKRQEYADFYGSGEPPYVKSKSQKERTKHRQRDRSVEVIYGASGVDPKPVEVKPVDYDNLKFDHYNMRSKYVDGPYRF